MFRRLHVAGRPVPLVTLVFAGNPQSKYTAFSVGEIKVASPQSIVIARDVRGDDYQGGNIGGWDNATRAHGLDYFNHHIDFLNDDIRKADFIQVRDVNETGEGYGINAWWQGMLDGADRAGVKLAVYNFSVGNPSLPGERDASGKLRPYNDFWKWQSTVDLLRRVKRDGHALCLHQYAYWDQWGKMMRTPSGDAVENTLLYRHRAIFRVLPADLQDMKVYFNEFGEAHLAEGTPTDHSPERIRERFTTAQHELDGDIGDPVASTWTLGTAGDSKWDKDELTSVMGVIEDVGLRG